MDTMRDRLVEDHVNARRLADGLAELDGISIDPARVETNIVAFELAPSVRGEAFRDACASDGLRISSYGGNWRRLRMVTHHGLGARDVDVALEIIRRALADVRGPVVTPAD
jgi:threonine aldolase